MITEIVLKEVKSITLAWSLVSATVFFSNMVIEYLRSKPPILQTVMDAVNYATFWLLIATDIHMATVVTISELFCDPGEEVSLALGWIYFILTKAICMELICNVAVQFMIVQKPILLDNETFERLVKLTAFAVVPVTSVTMSLALQLRGTKPYMYFYLRGSQAPENSPLAILHSGMVITLVLMFIFSRGWIQRKGYYLNAQSNHIIQTRVIAVTVVFALVSGAVCDWVITEPKFQIVPLLSHCLLATLTVFCHPCLRIFALRRAPICQILTAVKRIPRIRARRINIEQDISQSHVV